MSDHAPPAALHRRRLLGLGAAGAAATLARPALAKGLVQWRMVTSWPKNLPGPGVSAERLASAIGALSDGRLTIRVYSAGELVPALETFDAVAGGTADMAHTAALYWQGKMAAAPLFTTAPFGLTSLEHLTWIAEGGGQALWDRLYHDAGVKPFLAGNTGFSMAGWFRREIVGLDDLKGLKIRVAGLGGEVYRRLGATPVSLPAGEILPALQSGVVDAAEFLAPHSDIAAGFPKVVKLYYGPGFNKPNGAGEALVSTRAWEALAPDLREIVAAACAREHMAGLAAAEWQNAAGLALLARTHGVSVRPVPSEILSAARSAAESILDDIAARDSLSGEVVASYRAARDRLGPWMRITAGAFFGARAAP